MATRKKNNQEEEVLVDIVEVRDNFQGFYEKNHQIIWGALIGLVVIVGGYLGYSTLYMQPRQQEAMAQMYQAQLQFERDSFAKGLTSPGSMFPGFLDIQEQYSGTKAANLANYYIGVSYLNLGKFEAAADYLGAYKAATPEMKIMKNGALGDTYAELQDWDKALDYYGKAASSDNDLLTPYYLKKLGMLHERNGNAAAAASAYQKIKDDYAQSVEGRDIDKFLSRTKG